MRVETKKALVSDNNKSFNVGDDIYFTYKEQHYIGEIVDISDNVFIIKNIEQERKKKVGTMWIPVNEISNCNYVYYD